MQEIISNWLNWLQKTKKYSEHTIRGYSKDLQDFINFQSNFSGQVINAEILQKMDSRDFRSWLADRKNRNIESRSNNRALSSVKNFYRYMYNNDLISDNITVTLKNAKFPKSLPKALSVNDAVNFCSELLKMNPDDWQGLRNYALLLLLYGSGLRISEALNLSMSDLNFNKCEVKVLGKGGKERVVPVLPISLQAIEQYTKICPYPVGEILFFGARGKKLQAPLLRKEIRYLRNILNLGDLVTPHSFRHSYASHLLSAGGDIRVIQELLGHKNLSTTEIYTKIENQQLLDSYMKFNFFSEDN